MADFSVWATAMEGTFGWDPGSFVDAYEANRQGASETLLANCGEVRGGHRDDTGARLICHQLR
jgi:hypothetical protein